MSTTMTTLYTTLSDRPVYALAILLIITILITRLLSSKQPERAGPNGAKRIPAVPYILPILGHLPSMFYDAKTFTRRLRAHYHPDGAYSLNFGGTVHNVLFSPSLATALVNVKAENADEKELFRGIMGKVFGFPLGSEGAKYDAALVEVNALYKNFMSDPGLSEMTARTARNVKASIASFVTGSKSLVDQMHWERNASAEIKTDSHDDNGEPDHYRLGLCEQLPGLHSRYLDAGLRLLAACYGFAKVDSYSGADEGAYCAQAFDGQVGAV
jgi:hypothetical protein